MGEISEPLQHQGWTVATTQSVNHTVDAACAQALAMSGNGALTPRCSPADPGTFLEPTYQGSFQVRR